MGENELAIARKARAAEGEAEELRAENARLRDMLDAMRAQANGLAIKPVTDGKAKCHRCVAVYVNIKERTVECQHCGSLLDPLDVLHEFATGERNLLQWNAHYKAEQMKLRNEIDALKGDAARARIKRVECPRGCRKFVAISDSHPRGVTPHTCYAVRANLGLVPKTPETRWRIVSADGQRMSRWADQVSAMRGAASETAARVEEYTGPIGERAERAAERVEFERQWREGLRRSAATPHA